MRHGLILAVLFLLGNVAVADEKFTLSGENTKIEFVGSKTDGKHTGGFKKLTGTASIDGDVSTLKVEVEIAMDSTYADDEKLTAHLKSPDFFGVKAHPKATFKSTKVAKSDAGADITGELTLNGKSKEITVPAKVESKDGVLTLNSEFKIDRNDFGIVYGKGKIDSEVALKVAISAKK